MPCQAKAFVMIVGDCILTDAMQNQQVIVVPKPSRHFRANVLWRMSQDAKELSERRCNAMTCAVRDARLPGLGRTMPRR